MRMGAANEHIKAALDALSLECAANVHWGFVAVMLRSAGVELSMAADYADECDDLDMGVSVDTPLVEVDERPEPFLPSPDHVCDKGGEA